MSFPETVVLTVEEVKRTTATQRCPLGTRGVLPDGRVFRYAKNGATALALGKLVTSEAPAGNYFATSGGVTPAATTFTSTWAYIQIVSSHQCDATAETADTYAEGYMIDPTDGQMLKIKSHAGHTASSTEQTKFYLDDNDRLSVSITGTDQCMMIVKNPYDDVIVAGAVGAGGALALGYPVVGVPINRYFWVQTWGPCGVLMYNTNAAGQPLVHSTETVGSIGKIASTDCRLAPKVGDCINPSATTVYGIVQLKLSP